ncbi:ribosomal protein S6 kinase delta-1 isoform X6 [Dipodomys merriami]|uniref:ribosomal protein S6 kinase delta-1 isoform X6 n=1 Tax=Dipodomys merriami TaxID=94247 RepID=UPI003855D683
MRRACEAGAAILVLGKIPDIGLKETERRKKAAPGGFHFEDLWQYIGDGSTRELRGKELLYHVYKVVSRRNPEDVQEIIVWKRYSDFKKLHKELWQIHKNLFRHSELFPPFAKGIVFGRFDKTVIEERRQCAEDLLQFSANIPALYNSKQLEDFFKGGIINDGSELIGPAEAYSDSIVDIFPEYSTEGFSSDSDLLSLTVDADSLAELDDGMASNQSSPIRTFGLSLSSDSSALGAVASDSEPNKAEEEREIRSLFPGSLKPRLGKRDYLEKAGELIKLALKKEEEDDYEAASDFYRKGVDLLLEGVQGESSPRRREAVKRRTAEYLMRAESISSLYRQPQPDDGSQPPGSLSSRPPWNLRSPAEELKAFRVLGVIDKVLLVMDTRTDQTFILKGLRKSSEYSRNRKTIIPRCVPNMVCLHKYIISEESVFLVLQHVEGGKLWSYISKFLNRSTEESFDIKEMKKSTPTKVYLQQPTCSPQDSGSFESRGSDRGSLLKALPLKASLTPSSQDDSNQEDEGQDSSPKWPDSGSSSEEECTTSYLTLCNEYGQEKIDPGSLNEELCIKTEGDNADTRAVQSFPAPLAADSDSPSSQLKFFPGDEDSEAVCSPRTSDSLSRSKNSPMEFFRIDRHIQLTYFSRWSEVEDSCDSDAIERMYCAPEVGAITEETEACDWWSLGAVLFELLTGKTLVECHPAGINTHTTLNMPECISEEARSLIQQLLQFNPLERLGAGVAGVEDIKSHPFFTPVDWAELMR